MSRNKGLFTADQKLNGNTAKYTRQNPNGARSGLECPEERDYYPWWHASPWKDIAVLTDEVERCGYYQEESMNQKPRTADDGSVTAAWDLPPPECRLGNFTRPNHLGDIPEGVNAYYDWTLPTTEDACSRTDECECVFRLRYNMSTGEVKWDLNASHNNIDLDEGGVIEDNPVVDLGVNQGFRLAINTNQHGRTFQDRSHIFKIVSRDGTGLDGAAIHNINVRGKRGNIVQVYPAVEYDFTPNVVRVKQGDYVHFQWTGSNSHNNGNNGGDGQTGDDGQGTGGTDRSNVVQIVSLIENYPMKYPPPEGEVSMFPDRDTAFAAATVGNENVDTLLNNAPATFNAGPMQMNTKGTFYYMCTRNNNFSNRSQKGTIIVE